MLNKRCVLYNDLLERLTNRNFPKRNAQLFFNQVYKVIEYD